MTRHIDINAPGMKPWEPVELSRTIETGGADWDTIARGAEFSNDPAAAYDPVPDRLADLDAKIADWTPPDESSRAAADAADRRDLLEAGVPSVIAEMALPGLNSASQQVRDEATAILARGRGVQPGTHQHNLLVQALDDLNAENDLRPDMHELGRAVVEDDPTLDALTEAWGGRYGHGRRGPGSDLGASSRAGKRDPATGQ